MNRFWALFHARNIEFYRDRGALLWAFVFPLLIIVGFALAFSQDDNTILKVGVIGEPIDLRLTGQGYIETVNFEHRERALDQVRHHQIDLLLQTSGERISYWFNPDSAKGQAARELLLSLDRDRTLDEQTLTGKAVRYVDWVMPGVLAMNMMFASLFGIGYVIVRYRQNGVLKRLQATPVSALQFISAQMMSRLLIVLGVNVAIFVGGKYLLDLLVLGHYLDLLLIGFCGALSLLSLGLLVAARTASEELAGGLLNLLTWPMMFFSEIWFSLENAPRWMQWMADLLPLTHLVKAARAVMIEGAGLADVAVHLAVMLVMTTVFLGAAARLFRWQRG